MDPLVLKIKHGGVLRRLTLPKGDGIVLSYTQLLSRARDLFRLPATALAAFTYVDEDGDVVALAGDRDLEDALVLQGLNPLRLTMKVGATEAVSRVARNETEQGDKKDSAKAPEKRPNPFAFGTPAFGQKPTTSFGGFGTTPAQPNPFGTFGQTQSAFGSQPFGSTSAFGATYQPAFGSTYQPAFGSTYQPAFGSTYQPAFGSTTTPAFGSSTPAFGASTTPAFGSTTTTPFGSSTPAFGSSSVFGQSTPAFGSSSSPAFGSPSFGGSASSPFDAARSGSSTFGASTSPDFSPTTFRALFAGQRNGSRAVPYAVTNDPDVSVGGEVGKFTSISAMPAYNSKSPEELRWEDYQAWRAPVLWPLCYVSHQE